ncbi:hypothetical protein AB6A40_008396 [Gnathostoma spinigerum]|uniref:Uncharacterized protein n=1 Tax=Gnathostoma spinigerum TaxID=75299 RepID=A0ABD6ERB7_9BILA
MLWILFTFAVCAGMDSEEFNYDPCFCKTTGLCECSPPGCECDIKPPPRAILQTWLDAMAPLALPPWMSGSAKPLLTTEHVKVIVLEPHHDVLGKQVLEAKGRQAPSASQEAVKTQGPEGSQKPKGLQTDANVTQNKPSNLEVAKLSTKAQTVQPKLDESQSEIVDNRKQPQDGGTDGSRLLAQVGSIEKTGSARDRRSSEGKADWPIAADRRIKLKQTTTEERKDNQ